jgi:diguanylate cyclase (GGDEF)-like protein
VDNRRAYHRSLERQLRRLNLSAVDPPDAAGWAKLLGLVNAAYREAEADRYTLERSIEVSSEEMRALHDVLSRQARHDTLTGLPNRAALTEILATTLTRGRLTGRAVAVLFVDLDGFKLVNDGLGHAAGDELLLRAAERIRGAARETDVVARLGGDEFVVVCGDFDTVETATAVARRIVAQIEQPFRIGSQDAVVGASIGIAVAGPDAVDAEDLLSRADLAMYEAKAGGRGRFVLFDDDMRRRVDCRLALAGALRHAASRNELALHFQAIFGLSDRRLLGLEALVRWDRPGHGLVMPDAFIPVAEETRLITAIDSWVIQVACERFARWAWSYPTATIAVNLSARDLQSPDVVDTVSRALQSTGLSPWRLVLELTETTIMSGNAAIAANLACLRALGVRLAIDDFGTGYSSLSYLRQLPAQILKLDRTFVSELDSDEAAAAIVGAIVTMGHALGLKIIAEGVERPAQAEKLRQLGCDAAQGHLFAHPQPLEQLGTALQIPPAGWAGVELSHPTEAA